MLITEWCNWSFGRTSQSWTNEMRGSEKYLDDGYSAAIRRPNMSNVSVIGSNQEGSQQFETSGILFFKAFGMMFSFWRSLLLCIRSRLPHVAAKKEKNYLHCTPDMIMCQTYWCITIYGKIWHVRIFEIQNSVRYSWVCHNKSKSLSFVAMVVLGVFFFVLTGLYGTVHIYIRRESDCMENLNLPVNNSLDGEQFFFPLLFWVDVNKFSALG